MFTEALFIVAPTWKQPKRPIVNRVNYIQTIKYHVAMKKNELLLHVTTCKNLISRLLSKSSPTQNSTYCVIQIYKVHQ